MDTVETMRAFVAVAAEGGFTKGAKRLGRSVQNTSKSVRQLEETLNAQLFDRTTRSVSLNATGRALLSQCSDLVERYDEVLAAVSAQQGKPSGTVRITAPTAFGSRHLTPALAPFLKQYPEVSIELSLTDRRVSLVEEGFDLAIRVGTLDDSSMIARKLTAMRVVVVAAPGYLADHGRPAHPDDLVEHRCIIDTNFRSDRRWRFQIEGGDHTVPIEGPFVVNSPEATRAMAVGGVGIGMCPMYVVNADIVAGRLLPLFEEHEAYDFGVYAIYPHSRHLAVRVRALIDHLVFSFRRF